MSITLVTSVAKGSPNGLGFDTSDQPINTVGGSLAVAAIIDYVGGPGVTLTDSEGLTWSLRTNYDSPGNSRVRFLSAPIPAGDSAHVFAAAGDGAFATLLVKIFAGAHATPYDGTENGNSATGTTLQPGSITPSQAGCVVLSALAMNAEGLTAAIAGTGWQTPIQVGQAGGQHFGGAMSHRIQTTAGAENPTWSWGGSTELMAANIAAFRAAAAGGVAIPVLMANYRRRR